MLNKFRSSLGAKITCMLFTVSVILLGIAWFAARHNAEKEMEEYYKQLSRVVSSFSCDVVTDYIHDPYADTDKMQMLGAEIKSLCKDELIDMVFIAKENEEKSDVGDILMIVSDDSMEIKGVGGYQGTYTFSSEELEIMDGRKDETTIIYHARIGEVISFIYGYDIADERTGDTKRMIVGSNVTLDMFNSSIASIMRNLFLGMFLIIIVVLVLIRIMIYKTAVIPFRVLSSRMKHLVQNNKMYFEPMTVTGHDERASAAQAFNLMGGEIRSYIESIHRLEGERQKNLAEVKVASEIQRGLLPESEYTGFPFTVKGYMQPAQNVGGDLYYYYRLDDNRMAFAIGDVSGKGISAALFMAGTVGAIKYNLQNCSSPGDTLKAINRDIIANNPNRLFVTLFIGIVDSKQHTLTYANAGHNPPYKIGKKIEQLTGGKGTLAGIFASEEYEDAVVSLDEHDRIFLYTDGVTEAVNAQKEFFGQKRLESLFSADNEDLIGTVLKQVTNYIQGTEQFDDITMMTIGFTDKEPAQAKEY